MATSNLIALNGIELTDDGRTFNENHNLKVVDVELADGGLRRYNKAFKKSFSFAWDWCPNASSDTRDSKGARDTIKSLALSGASMTLTLRNHPTQAASSYTVVLSSYQEDLLRRDYVSNKYFYSIRLELIEV